LGVDNTSLPPQGSAPKARRGRVARLWTLPLAALALAGCTVPTFGAAPGVTKQSKDVYHLWQGFSIGAVVIGAFVIALMAWAVLRYRRKGDTIPRQTQYQIPLELAYTIIPILIVFGLFVATLVVENPEVSNPTPAATINVNAFQWGWKFTYPGANVSVVGQTTQTPTMVMPVNENVRIHLTSTDVVHGFYVKSFNFSRFALPGVNNEFTFYATKTGTYFGQCTQLCGLYHSLMFFKVKVVSASDYQAWLTANANPAAANANQNATNQQTSANVPAKSTSSNGVN
jgi:cytochrome c oxidase subunit II